MLVSKAAQRYASALLELAEENNSVEKTLEDINFIRNTLSGSRDLLLFLKNPIVKPEKKADALNAIFSGKISEQVQDFIQLITKKNRENLLDEIAEAFLQKYRTYAGILIVEVRSAYELNEKQQAEIIKKLEDRTGKKIELDLKVVPELKGGIAVKIGDTVIDGSVKHKLEQLEQKFMETAAV